MNSFILATGKLVTVTVEGLDENGDLVVNPGENVKLRAVAKGNLHPIILASLFLGSPRDASYLTYSLANCYSFVAPKSLLKKLKDLRVWREVYCLWLKGLEASSISSVILITLQLGGSTSIHSHRVPFGRAVTAHDISI